MLQVTAGKEYPNGQKVVKRPLFDLLEFVLCEWEDVIFLSFPEGVKKYISCTYLFVFELSQYQEEKIQEVNNHKKVLNFAIGINKRYGQYERI